jgi:hypothetical protein
MREEDFGIRSYIGRSEQVARTLNMLGLPSAVARKDVGDLCASFPQSALFLLLLYYLF